MIMSAQSSHSSTLLKSAFPSEASVWPPGLCTERPAGPAAGISPSKGHVPDTLSPATAGGITAFAGQSWLWPCHLQAITDFFPQMPAAWLSTTLPPGVGLFWPLPPWAWGCMSGFTSKLGWVSSDRVGRMADSSAFPESSCGNASQGASSQGNSLCRFFKRVADAEELCEGPVAPGTPSLSPSPFCVTPSD